MNKTKGIKDPLFLGVVSLQIAALFLVGKDTRGDSLPARQLTNLVSPATITMGSRISNFPAYTSRGRQTVVSGQRPATLIFKTDCTCDMVQVAAWIKAATRRNETVTVIVRASPDKLGRIQRENELSGQVLAARSSDLAMLGLLERMPIAVHVSSSGIVVATES